MNKESLVSVVLVGEASPPEQINHFITQIVNEQTHKNLDILVVTIPRDDLESLQDEWNEKASGYTIRFLEAAPGIDLVAMGADSAMGEVVFYKSQIPVSSIWIQTIEGKKIVYKKMEEHTVGELDTSQIPAGIYFLVVESAKSFYFKRIIIN